MRQLAVDAMGGDQAPREVCAGVLAALEAHPDVALTLVGPADEVRRTLEQQGWRENGAGGRLALHHASEVVAMADHPAEAYRAKKDSSIARGFQLLREGRAKAFISAGSTGAMVVHAALDLKVLDGIRRPAIAAAIPQMTPGRWVTVMDVGANLDPRPSDLVDYGIMAEIWTRRVLGVERPTIGVLNIGVEREKGTSLVREAARLLDRSGLPFVGFVEGHDLFAGKCDVALCEAFVGNILLKAAEGLGVAVISQIGTILGRRFAEFGAKALEGVREAVGELSRTMDWATVGGALLLGAVGMPVICHGRSDARAIRNAIGMAARCLDLDLASEIVERAAEVRARCG